MTVTDMARRAREAGRTLARTNIRARNAALYALKEALCARKEAIFAANAEDMARAGGLAEPLRKRLKFDENKLAELLSGLDSLIALPDPLHRTLLARELCEGLTLYRVTKPIGVIGMVLESRPDALIQIASLCLKSGNAVLLKGGSEAMATNRALHECLLAIGLPDGWASLLASREDVTAMLALDEYIDLLIPRGSNAFVRYIMQNSRIPVMGHADGVCHVYVDRAADIGMAVRVTVDAKTQYMAVCNAAETLLVHSEIAAAFLPACKAALDEKHVILRGCERARAIIPCQPATEDDWRAEYLDAVLAVRVVDDLESAIAHINRYGSGHTDCIITDDQAAAAAFMDGVDSAGVFQNCSTRFADGFRYGFGAEVGISTSKLHARGPVGLEGLCTYTYKLIGSGQTVGETKAFTHRDLSSECPYR